MSTELTTQQSNMPVEQKQPALPNWLMTEKWAESAFKSGLFKSVNNMHQAVVKITMGLELGISPMRAMQSIYIVSGNITMNGTLIAALIKQSGRYTYAVTQIDDKACAIDFYERDHPGADFRKTGISRFTIEDAQRAGLHAKDNWRMYPRNMLFNRAISNGARWYCPDIFTGAVYTPDEMDLRVDAKGDVIEEAMQVPDRDEWQRNAAALLYEKVAPELVAHIQKLGRDVAVTYEAFTQLLYDVAGDHAIPLEDNPRMPRTGKAEDEQVALLTEAPPETDIATPPPEIVGEALPLDGEDE